MKIYCLSENEILSLENKKQTPVESKRMTKYIETLRHIEQRDEWKTSGKGAKFMGLDQQQQEFDSHNINAYLSGLSTNGSKMVYSIDVDGMGGLYLKDFETGDENLIFSNQKLDIGAINCKGDKCVASLGYTATERHIAVFDLTTGNYEEITEGDTCEDYPFFSQADTDKILFSSRGYARNQAGQIMATSPYVIGVYDNKTRELSEVVQSEEFDYLKPKDDSDGNLYYIKRNYKEKQSTGSIFVDIIMFPVRIVKAIGGFLNVFSMAFGGESLRSNGSKNSAKAKQKSQKDIFVEGNMINAEKTMQENDRKSNDFSGVIPHSWQLIKRTSSGEEAVLAKGVMDYFLCDNGDIFYSNGSWVIKLSAKDGKEEPICKVKLANQLLATD